MPGVDFRSKGACRESDYQGARSIWRLEDSESRSRMDGRVLFLGALILCTDVKLIPERSTHLSVPLPQLVFPGSLNPTLIVLDLKQREVDLLTEAWGILVHSSASLSSTDIFK